MLRHAAFVVFTMLFLIAPPRPAHAGDRPLCVYFIDLANSEHDAVRDSILATLLREGCWADSCGDNWVIYTLRRDLPSGVTLDDVRRAAGGDRRAMAKLTELAGNEAEGEHRYFWQPDGYLVYDRRGGGRVVELTGIAMPEKRKAPKRVMVRQTSPNEAAGIRAVDGLLKRALKPLWAQFSV